MYRPLPILLSVLSALALSVPSARTARANDADRVDAAPTEILVDLRDDTTDEDEKEVEGRLGGLHLRPNSAYAATHDHLYIGEVDPSRLPELIARLKDDPRVENAEPNYIYQMTKAPNDPMWKRQWSFRMIDAPAAWDIADGSGVVVAVIDTGIAFEDYGKFRRVEDLAGVEFVKGYNFVTDDEHANDDHGHGTHVAGTIAQATNNGIGVAGLAHKAKLMPLKVLNRNGMGTAADIADAIRFAADEGAKVINMSLGGGARSAVMESAVAYARKKGLVVVCAAGNGSRGRVEYPAAYAGAFAVSAVGPDKKLAFYSSWGKELAISAPGGDKQKGGDDGAVLQNTISPDNPSATNLYLAFQGTSMAAPHVAGAAALVISAGVTDVAKVESILKETAEDLGPSGWDDHYGAGLLNVGRAVQKAQETSGGLWHLLAGLGTLALFALRGRKNGPAGHLGLGAVLGTVLGASGLWFVKLVGVHLASVPVLGVLSTPMPNWDQAILGPSWHFTALWASFVPVTALIVVLLGAKKLRGFLIGLALGWAAFFVVSSISMPSDVQLIPGAAGVLDRIWLLLNAGILLAIARLVALVSPGRR